MEYPEGMYDVMDCWYEASSNFDKLGIDVLLAGTQKAWALPPGFGVFVVSAEALERAAKTETRGYYFDFLENGI